MLIFRLPLSASDELRLKGANIVTGFVSGEIEGWFELHADSSSLLYWKQLVFRNPLREVLSTLDSRMRSDIFERLATYVSVESEKTWMTIAAFDFDNRQRTVRLRELGRDRAHPASSAMTEALVRHRLVEVARALGANRIVTETFDRYGEKLLSYGWKVDWSGRNAFMRAACLLNGYKPYALTLQ